MYSLSGTSGSDSNSSAQWEAGDTPAFVENKEFRSIIQKANKVSLIDLFKFYKIKFSKEDRKIICPFKHHLNGHESSPSFYFYPKPNTFWCFGCKTGSTPVDFVSNIEDLNYLKSAQKILSLYNCECEDDLIINHDDFAKRMQIMMDFSNFIREIRNPTYNISIENIENICKIYDKLNQKHDLSNEALEQVVFKLKSKLL